MSTITFDKTIRYLGIFLSLLLAGWLVFQFANLVIYAFVAIIITYILDPLVNRMQAAGINRTAAILLTLASLILVVIWISTNIFPVIVNQMVELARQLNIENLQMIASKVEGKINRSLPFLPPGFLKENMTNIASEFFDIGKLPSALSNVIGVFTNIFSAILVISLATFFFLKDGSRLRRELLRLVPNKYFESTISLLDKIESRLGMYFRGVLLQSFLVGLFSWLTLSIIGLQNALSVGIAVGLANAIPYFGPVIGYLLSIIVSIIETGTFILVPECILAILVVQAIDNVILQPLIFSRAANMHPVAILFIIMIGAEIGGMIGMLLAIPVATIIQITINQIKWCIDNYYVFRMEK